MRILCNIDQAACIRAGIDAPHSTSELEIDPASLSQIERDLLAATLSAGHKLSGFSVCPPTAEGLRAALAEKLAQRAAEATQREQRILVALAAPAEDWITADAHTMAYRIDRKDVHKPMLLDSPRSAYLFDSAAQSDPRIQARRSEIARTVLAPAAAEWQAAHDKAEAEDARARADAIKVAEAKSARRADQIATWIATRATEGMRKRQARGLLPDEDILGAMADEVFAPVADLARYEPMTADEVRRELGSDDSYGDPEAVDFGTRDAESAHDEDVALMERIEAAIPGAKCELIEHFGYLKSAAGSDDPELTRFAIRATVTVGELTFKRSFAPA
jgi:hypothetical protein